ncbi:hypothetical protein MF271_09700 [Deinococcus sp. KNUC1210]|uniref:hypothetical protein n=1 Tax=Deinococcus sp. KNUC1210 TaxID=2917691 RepID=UPI001EF01E8D|nr:hypothetical protein [Deinococcus sp. KNUC1210]ULH16814.1 hypothetical protein MF271_09700 [Deinococcus sp. KNUC1210]
MNFPTTCPHCGQTVQTEYLDSGIHDLTCPNCQQRWVLFIRKHRFEMLFDLGTRALLMGFAREAVSNFASALERCFEFYLKAALLERAASEHRDLTTVSRELDATWKLLISQSERQLGAFAAVYFSRQGQAPDFLTPQSLQADFRNRVIHRGYLPREEEVDAYAARLFAIMNRLLEELGDAALQVTVLQEREYAAALDRLPGNVTAVFEEHPGMFRTRREQTQPPQLGSPASVPPTPRSAASSAPSPVLNDAAAFQTALRERGTLVAELFGKRKS